MLNITKTLLNYYKNFKILLSSISIDRYKHLYLGSFEECYKKCRQKKTARYHTNIYSPKYLETKNFICKL